MFPDRVEPVRHPTASQLVEELGLGLEPDDACPTGEPAGESSAGETDHALTDTLELFRSAMRRECELRSRAASASSGARAVSTPGEELLISVRDRRVDVTRCNQ